MPGNGKAPLGGGAFTYAAQKRSSSRCLFRDCGIDTDLVAALALVLELHLALDQGVDRVVVAHADVRARMPLRAALADDDVARDDPLAAELLDAAVFRIAVAPVTRRADAFFMSHIASV